MKTKEEDLAMNKNLSNLKSEYSKSVLLSRKLAFKVKKNITPILLYVSL